MMIGWFIGVSLAITLSVSIILGFDIEDPTVRVLIPGVLGFSFSTAGLILADRKTGYERVPQTEEEDQWAEANAREAIREEPWQ